MSTAHTGFDPLPTLDAGPLEPPESTPGGALPRAAAESRRAECSASPAAAATAADSLEAPPMQVDPLALGIAFALVLMVAQRAIGFARGLLFCRLLSDEQLGQWSAVWSLLLLLPPLASLGLTGSFSRYSEHFRQRGQLAAYVRRVGTISGLTTALLAGVLCLAPQRFAEWIFRDPRQTGLIYALAAALLLVAWFNAVQALLESLRQVRVVTWMRFIQGAAFAVIAPVLLAVGCPGTLAVVAGFGSSCLVGCWPVWGFVRRNPTLLRAGDRLPQRAFWLRVAPFAAWIWVTNLLANSYESVDRFMLLHLLGGTPEAAQGALGQYHSSLLIPQLLSSLAVVIAGIVLPYLTAHWERQERDDARRIWRWALKSLGICFFYGNVAVLLLAPWLYHGFLQGRYEQGLEILPLSMTFCYWLGMGTLAQTAQLCGERVRLAAGTLAIGLFANALLNWLLVPTWGLWGAVSATAGANAICLAAILAISHRQGWRCDRGLVLVAALPLAWLAGPVAAVGTGLLLGYLLLGTNWIFAAAERREFAGKWQAVRSRLAVRWAGVNGGNGGVR